jgi:xanthoxin dehydrogenase
MLTEYLGNWKKEILPFLLLFKYIARLEGKVALITGGASGIGEATTKLFIKHGAKVCIADIRDDRGELLCESLGGGTHARFFHCDVSKEDEISKAVDFTSEAFGTLDILVNNAGITGNKVLDIRDVDFREFKKVFEINVDGAFLGIMKYLMIYIIHFLLQVSRF